MEIYSPQERMKYANKYSNFNKESKAESEFKKLSFKRNEGCLNELINQVNIVEE